MLLATRDAQLEPTGIRAVGLEVEADRTHVTVFVPAVRAARTLADLKVAPRVAVTLSRPYDHRTYQLKGDCVGIAEATSEQRAVIEAYRAGLAVQFDHVGIPRRVTARVAYWPAWAIRLRVTHVFNQTPGPGAGEPMGETPGASS
jgi:hypothetical protein